MIIEEIKKFLNDRDFNNISIYFSKACGLLGYQKIGECAETSNKPFYFSSNLSPGFEEIINISTKEESGTKCVHYGNCSKIPEGIVYKMSYIKQNGNPMAFPESVNIFGYGDNWWDKGETSEINGFCKKELKLPEDLIIASKIDLEKFIQELRLKVHMVEIPIA